MNKQEKLAMLRVMVGQPNEGEWADDVLDSYLAIAGRKIVNKEYPYDDTKTEHSPRYDYLECEIAAYLLNKRGAEGQTAHSENGISRSYESADVPSSMLREVVPKVGVM